MEQLLIMNKVHDVITQKYLVFILAAEINPN